MTPRDGTAGVSPATDTAKVTATDSSMVSISADKTTAVYREDTITYTLTRTGSTTAALPVSVTLTQTKNFLLATTDLTKTVTIPAGQSTETFTVAGSSFQHFPVGDVVEGGTLTATVQDVLGYDLGTPSSVAVNIVIGPMIRIENASYNVNEADGTLIVKLIARTGPGAPQPTANSSGVDIFFEDVTAIENTDYSTIQGNNFLFETGGFSMDGTEWQAEKTYIISVTNDDIDEDDETFLLNLKYVHNIFGKNMIVDASGNACDSVDGCEVTVTITDDDTAGVTVSKSAVTVTEQDTTGDTYTVVLDSQPTANVTITIGGQGAADITATPTPLTFTTTNWATAQTVTVTAGNDTDTVTDTHSLTHSAMSTDTKYSAISIASVGVTVNDDDSANSAPTFSMSTESRTLAENTAAGQNIGLGFMATDADSDTNHLHPGGHRHSLFQPHHRQRRSTAPHQTRRDLQLRGQGRLHRHPQSGRRQRRHRHRNGEHHPHGRDRGPRTTRSAHGIRYRRIHHQPDRQLERSRTNTGPDIDNYDLQYRQGTSGSFTNGPQNVNGTHHDHPEPFSEHVLSGPGAGHQRRGRQPMVTTRVRLDQLATRHPARAGLRRKHHAERPDPAGQLDAGNRRHRLQGPVEVRRPELQLQPAGHSLVRLHHEPHHQQPAERRRVHRQGHRDQGRRQRRHTV